MAKARKLFKAKVDAGGSSQEVMLFAKDKAEAFVMIRAYGRLVTPVTQIKSRAISTALPTSRTQRTWGRLPKGVK